MNSRKSDLSCRSASDRGGDAAMPLLEVDDLSVDYMQSRGRNLRRVGRVLAVDGVSFSIPRGRTLGLVGESGCGKTTIARTLLKLVEPSRGRIHFEKIDVLRARGSVLREIRRHMQMIFQDPFDSLNPRMTAGEIVAEPLRIQKKQSLGSCRGDIITLFEQVGLQPAHLGRYPHELSGGQRQRIGIARALASRPKLLVCDEPVSALDVSVQAQILNLLVDLQASLGLSYLFIAHDLAVVRHVSHRVAVMYLGRIVEMGPADSICRTPRHPYTFSLLEAVPTMDSVRRRWRHGVGDAFEEQSAPATGCAYHPHCRFATDLCRDSVPRLDGM
ncbi:MAG: ABC transporter ATP-binding protein, partial [Planctomycetes bacterium]|nr:ABC transporter ATP-binding protein [Planctomycetota bacterium]